MSSVQSIVLGLLENSSLPELYKSMLRNLLPDMSRVQQEEILTILYREKSEKETLKPKMAKTYFRYSNILDRLEEDPTAYDEEYNSVIGSRGGLKSQIEAGPASAAKAGKDSAVSGKDSAVSGRSAVSKLASLKSKLNLLKLKKNL